MVPDFEEINRQFFKNNAQRFNFISKEDCGKYTEELLLLLRNKDKNFFHLRKYGTQTQYRKHAIDVIAYDNRGEDEGSAIMEVDILGSAESADAYPSWQVRDTFYKPTDLMHPDDIDTSVNTEKVIPWRPYWGDKNSDKITRTLMFDYVRGNQLLNPGMGRWLNRTLHSAFLGPEGKPLGEEAALNKHRPEWCAILGLDPNTPIPDDYFPEYK